MVVIFLETAELRAKNRIDVTMDFWRENVDKILVLNDKKVLKGKGAVSNALMEKKVEEMYETFNSTRKKFDAQKADESEMEELKRLEKEIKGQK